MSNIKLKDHNWAAEGIYDTNQSKSQQTINSDVNTKIGQATLQTSSQNLSGATNELKGRADTLDSKYDNVVTVANTQPSSQYNKVWLPLTVSEGTQVPTWAEHQALESSLNGAINSKAPINSPTFTGTPKGVTPTAGDNSTNIATTAFVQGEFTSHVFYKMLANNASYTFPISNGHCYMVFAIRVSTMGQVYGLWLIDSWGGIVATANMQAVTISYSNGVGTVTNISGGYVNVAILDFPEK